MLQVDPEKDKEKKADEESAEVKKEEGAAESAGEKDKEPTAAAAKKAETPQDRLIKDGQLQSAATVRSIRQFAENKPLLDWILCPVISAHSFLFLNSLGCAIGRGGEGEAPGGGGGA